MQRPPELLKSFANRLAHLVTSSDGARTIQLLRLAGLFTGSAQPAGEASAEAAKLTEDQPPDCERVGIWERKSGHRHFVRSTDKAKEWTNWANTGRIDPKGARRRIVLIGESVARGYLYDPQFTPAKALEVILQSRMGQSEVEVIDLARTDLGTGFLDLAQSALLLEPDAVVILAGNNWRSAFCFDPKNPDQVRSMVTALRDRGIHGLKELAQEQLTATVTHLVRTVNSLYAASGTPVIWLVPEFNLGDWLDPETNAPHLEPGANLEWITCRETAHSALRDGDLSACVEAARKMTELDRGVSASGLRLLAECSQRSGDSDAARHYLEMARDSLIWDTSRAISPRPFLVVQESLRAEVKEGLVDLPAVFKDYLGGGLPDRRLFLDYCHLNSRGILIAMAAAASSLLRSLNGTEVHWEDLADHRIAPAADVEAEASFLAAIHNAHWWQTYDVIEHYCLQSVKASARIGEVMGHFLDLQSRRAPMLMCESAEQIAASGSPQIAHYLLQHNLQLLDGSLLDAVVVALKKLGIDARPGLDQVRRAEHSVANGTINLLDSYYCSAALQPQELFWALPMAERSLFKLWSDYYNAYSIESRFVFVGEAGVPVRLRLTCRLPGDSAQEGQIHVEVNGKRIGETTIHRDWETWDLFVAAQIVVDGLNDVVIRWPVPAFPGDKALAATADDLAGETQPEFFPLFGEIHSFTASDGRTPQE
jgi:hypothetical protein